MNYKINNRMFNKIINKGYEASACQLCKAQFGLLQSWHIIRKLERIHKCKRCNRYVCWKCGNQKQKVLDEQGKWTAETHRVCHQCNTELNRINTLVQQVADQLCQKKLKWAKDSLLSAQWLKRMKQSNPKNGNKPKDYQYMHFLKLFHTNIKNFQEEAQIIEKDVIKGRTDYNVFNYSLRQFIYTVQSSDMKQKARINMANVLYAVAARFDQIGYVQGMSSVAAFLLCFCSEQSAYTIFCDLIENILPQKFLVRGNYGLNLIGLLAQTHFLKEYFVHIVTKVKQPLISHSRMSYTLQQIQHFRMLVQLSASKALLSLFVSFLSYTHIEFIWNQFSQHRTFQVAERAFLATLYLRRQQLLQRRSFKQLQQLFEGIQMELFVQTYYDMDIDLNLKQKLIQQFYESLNKKWSSSSEQNIKLLHRCTNFTEQQIKLLQQKFTKNVSMGVISKEDFVLLIKCYYQILKQNADTQAPILQITSHFVQKIFNKFVTNKSVNVQSPIVIDKRKTHIQNMQDQILGTQKRNTMSQKQNNKNLYLDFRQFVCCFSLCTKSLLKDRMCAIVNTFEDRNKKISFYSFQKLIKNICEISPPDIQDKKQAFLERMNRYFSNQEDGIPINQLSILLNDNFINELTMYIRSDSPGIIKKTLDKYFAIKEGKANSSISGISQF